MYLEDNARQLLDWLHWIFILFDWMHQHNQVINMLKPSNLSKPFHNGMNEIQFVLRSRALYCNKKHNNIKSHHVYQGECARKKYS